MHEDGRLATAGKSRPKGGAAGAQLFLFSLFDLFDIDSLSVSQYPLYMYFRSKPVRVIFTSFLPGAIRHFLLAFLAFELEITTMWPSLRDRFRGCLAGAVVGDCLGAVFEGSYWNRVVELAVVQKLTRSAAEGKLKSSQLAYTDDTAMARCVARSLIACQEFNATDMAER